MLTALAIWILGAFGVEPSPADLQVMVDESHLRGHHVTIDFGAFRGDVKRKPGIGLGYEYMIDRRYHGVSFEAFGLMLGRPTQVDETYWVGGGVGYFPLHWLKIFVQAGPLFETNSPEVRVFGRVGVGIRFPFFVIQVVPFLSAGTMTSSTAPDGSPIASEFVWTLGARLLY